ncbi:hypothetical protein V6N11_020999 [Hibiscus sabdariffa]|uniref:RNase H type-1 domain-containing protein n=1 Tax=Hibiscus sabdariffa TaxID=183260 RepID=A0ABR2A7F2_9ROSI
MGGFPCQLMGLVAVTQAISNLVNWDWNVRICHVGRMANKTADSLAKLSRVMHMSTLREVDSSCRFFLQPPREALVAFMMIYLV